jgi:hypothetical protein
MAMEFETPTDEEVKESESQFLSKRGTYHFAVIDADENPTWRSGKLKDQLKDGFEVEAAVQAGPEKGKTHRFFLRNPNLAHKDGGRFCKVLQGMFLEAIAVVNPADRGKKVTIELAREVNGVKQTLIGGRQFIATLKPSDDPKYLELDGTKVWHVDDPSADPCERNQAALSPNLYPPKFRRDPKSFEKQNGGGAAGGNGATKQPAASNSRPAGAAAGGVSLDDI